MEKAKRVKRSTRVKSKTGSLLKPETAKKKTRTPATDQSTGAQQLYEGRKVRSSSQDNSTVTEQEKTDRKKQHAREQRDSSQ